MLEGTRSKLRHETAQVDELLSSYSPLLKLAAARSPDLTEITAIATVLHSFYNGIENIFGIIAKEVDQHFPKGNAWYRELLDQMTRSSNARAAVIDDHAREILLEYLSFRHFFRHSYSFHLDWTQRKSLVTGLNANWDRIKAGIQSMTNNSDFSDSSTTQHIAPLDALRTGHLS